MIVTLEEARVGPFLIVQDPLSVDPQLGHQLSLQFHDIESCENIPIEKGLPTLVPPVRSQIEVALRFCAGKQITIVAPTKTDRRAVALARLLGYKVEGEANQLVLKLGDAILAGRND